MISAAKAKYIKHADKQRNKIGGRETSILRWYIVQDLRFNISGRNLN